MASERRQFVGPKGGLQVLDLVREVFARLLLKLIVCPHGDLGAVEVDGGRERHDEVIQTAVNESATSRKGQQNASAGAPFFFLPLRARMQGVHMTRAQAAATS